MQIAKEIKPTDFMSRHEAIKMALRLKYLKLHLEYADSYMEVRKTSNKRCLIEEDIKSIKQMLEFLVEVYDIDLEEESDKHLNNKRSSLAL